MNNKEKKQAHEYFGYGIPAIVETLVDAFDILDESYSFHGVVEDTPFESFVYEYWEAKRDGKLKEFYKKALPKLITDSKLPEGVGRE